MVIFDRFYKGLVKFPPPEVGTFGKIPPEVGPGWWFSLGFIRVWCISGYPKTYLECPAAAGPGPGPRPAQVTVGRAKTTTL